MRLDGRRSSVGCVLESIADRRAHLGGGRPRIAADLLVTRSDDLRGDLAIVAVAQAIAEVALDATILARVKTEDSDATTWPAACPAPAITTVSVTVLFAPSFLATLH